ncbi:MAG: hypothetical protein JWR50_3505 [Mucilaginibacter sp.]|nr:hypothetical protein [Mucilaginibacter sp.]
MKTATLLSAIILLGMLASCSKKKTVAPDPNTTISNFYYGHILGSPNTIIGPGNAILLRTNGTMREYANDYYSLGTSMTAGDTASAKIKLDGTYLISIKGSVTTVTATWHQPNGSPALTYTLVGTLTGNNMTGTLTDEGTGIGTVAQFSFTNAPLQSR